MAIAVMAPLLATSAALLLRLAVIEFIRFSAVILWVYLSPSLPGQPHCHCGKLCPQHGTDRWSGQEWSEWPIDWNSFIDLFWPEQSETKRNRSDEKGTEVTRSVPSGERWAQALQLLVAIGLSTIPFFSLRIQFLSSDIVTFVGAADKIACFSLKESDHFQIELI